MAQAKKKYSSAADERKARGRFMDQPGQWVNRTSAKTKKKQAAEWKKLDKMLKAGKKK